MDRMPTHKAGRTCLGIILIIGLAVLGFQRRVFADILLLWSEKISFDV